MEAEAGGRGACLCQSPVASAMAVVAEIPVIIIVLPERRETARAMPAAPGDGSEAPEAEEQILLAVTDRVILAARAEQARLTLILVRWSLMQEAVAVGVNLVQIQED